MEISRGKGTQLSPEPEIQPGHPPDTEGKEGSEPKPCVQPLDSGAAASATKSSSSPWKAERPDFFTMEEEQAGLEAIEGIVLVPSLPLCP
ncbi:hypothetical protein MC885_017500 [Smutsia gigantea]|nr:hypothetical protein MC885_017500 [Smutsia gigantea]